MAADERATGKIAGEATAPTEPLEGEPRWGFHAGQAIGDGRYVLRRRLGYGGMSTVWLGDDTKLDRPVAIKILADTLAADTNYVRRFDREARVAAGLVHSNLVSIYDFDAGERPFLVMEYVAGGDLAERLGSGTAPEPEALAHDLLSALDHIHSAGVVHRDVKPKNVLVGADGRALLTDFGIARPSDATALTRTGLVLGTSTYIAPEVLAGGESTERSDLYSAGVTLAEASEGRSVSDELGALIERLRAPDPVNRPDSAVAALRRLEAGPPAGAPEVPPPALPPTEPMDASAEPAPEPERSWANRWRMPIAMLPVVLALVVAALVIAALDDGGEDPVTDSGSGENAQAENREGNRDGDRGGNQRSEESAPTDGSALNDQGYALIEAGRYDEAIPVLEQAVAALEGTPGLTYAYALYNLGLALRLAGRPDEAIPILEQRLEIPNQTGAVREQLELAYAEAGITPESDGESSSELPPGQAKKLEGDGGVAYGGGVESDD